jgi:hypothetical protein
MEQSNKRSRDKEGDKEDKDRKDNEERGNELLKRLRFNRKKCLEEKEILKNKLFIPISDEQIIDDARKILKEIENNSSRGSSVEFSFDFNKQQALIINLYSSLLRIKVTLNNYKELYPSFNTFKDEQIKRLAIAISNESKFPFYDFKYPLKLNVLPSGIFDPPYGVSLGKKGLDTSIQFWWGIDRE